MSKNEYWKVSFQKDIRQLMGNVQKMSSALKQISNEFRKIEKYSGEKLCVNNLDEGIKQVDLFKKKMVDKVKKVMK